MIRGGLLLLIGLATTASAQTPELAPVVEQARTALLKHDVPALLGSSTRILLQLPGATPSAPIGKAHAEALLKSYLNDFEEVAAEVKGTSPSGEKSATVELRREYRIPGTSTVKSQTVLLAYQVIAGKWVVSEIRITQ